MWNIGTFRETCPFTGWPPLQLVSCQHQTDRNCVEVSPADKKFLIFTWCLDPPMVLLKPFCRFAALINNHVETSCIFWCDLCWSRVRMYCAEVLFCWCYDNYNDRMSDSVTWSVGVVCPLIRTVEQLFTDAAGQPIFNRTTWKPLSEAAFTSDHSVITFQRRPNVTSWTWVRVDLQTAANKCH